MCDFGQLDKTLASGWARRVRAWVPLVFVHTFSVLFGFSLPSLGGGVLSSCLCRAGSSLLQPPCSITLPPHALKGLGASLQQVPLTTNPGIPRPRRWFRCAHYRPGLPCIRSHDGSKSEPGCRVGLSQSEIEPAPQLRKEVRTGVLQEGIACWKVGPVPPRSLPGVGVMWVSAGFEGGPV